MISEGYPGAELEGVRVAAAPLNFEKLCFFLLVGHCGSREIKDCLKIKSKIGLALGSILETLPLLRGLTQNEESVSHCRTL